MRWPPWRSARPSDSEGKEVAKQQLEVARAIEHHAYILADESREILRVNNLGPKVHRALGGGR